MQQLFLVVLNVEIHIKKGDTGAFMLVMHMDEIRTLYGYI